MIVLVCLILGVLAGYAHAARRNGRMLDKLQYMAVYALIFSMLGLFATIFLEKLL